MIRIANDQLLHGLGLFSDEGADNCTVCEAGYYCGSNETTALAMYTGGGSWSSASDDAGMCFNGTFCAAGMNRAPGMTGELMRKDNLTIR